MEDEGGIDDGIGEINGFDIAALDKDEENEWQEVVRRRSRTSSSWLPKSASTHEQDINMVDGTGLSKGKQGRITIDSGTAESVIPPDMLEEVPTRSSTGSRAATHYIAANGGRMLNLGEKQVPNGRRPELKRAFPDD